MTAPLTALPPETLDGHIGFLGASGAGKTYGGKTAVEDLLAAGRRVCILDPTGVWWGLRAEPDGEEGGYPIAILGGDHADVPIADGSGAALARAIAEGDFSAIVDVSRMTVGARTRLFTDFAEELARVNRRPLHLVIDEAHLFMPQGRVNDPQSGRMVGAANHLVSGGRALGLRIVLLSQRPAKVHKDSLTQVATMVAMWMMAPQDTAAVKAWIAEAADAERGREVLSSLPSLQVGHGWIWSPRAGVFGQVAFRPLRTFDSSRAPALDEAPPTARLSALPLEELRAALAAEPAETPTPGKPERKASKSELETAEQRGFERGLSEGARREWVRWSAELQARNSAMLERLMADLAGERAQQEQRVSSPPKRQDRPSQRAPARTSPPRRAAGDLSASALKLLEVLRAPNLPDCARNWSDIAILAVLAPHGGSFNAARKQLQDGGHVARDGQLFAALAGDDPKALDAAAITQAWCEKLGGSARRILSSLYVREATKDELARDLDLAPKGGSWNAAWKALRDNNLVVEGSTGVWWMAQAVRAVKARRT